MKIKALIFLFCAFILFACSQTSKKSINATDKSTSSIKNETITSHILFDKKLEDETTDRRKVVHDKTIKVDTIIGDFHISYIVKDNDEIVSTLSYNDKGKTEITNYADRSIILNLKKGSKNILINREIRKPEFASIITGNEIKKYHIVLFEIKETSIYGITFSLNICKPDTDICYWIELFISNKGTFTFKEIDVREMGM